jgi:hypothetical protein
MIDLISFFEKKLEERLKNTLSIKGINFKIKKDICNDIKLFGCYEIIYTVRNSDENNYNVIGLNKISDNYRIEFGKYIILDTKYSSGERALFTSQFIEFDIREYREMKLNEILK